MTGAAFADPQCMRRLVSAGQEGSDCCIDMRCLNSHVRWSGTCLLRGWNDAEAIGASKRTVVLRFGGSVSDAMSQITRFQSLDAVSTYREFLDQLQRHRVSLHVPARKHAAHSTAVTPLTWPSSQRIVDLVSRSQMRAEPSARPAATNLPDGSKRANVACECSEVCTCVGYVIVKGSLNGLSDRTPIAPGVPLTSELAVHVVRRGWLGRQSKLRLT